MKIPTLESVTILIEDCLHATAPTVDEGYPLIRTPNIGRGRLDLNGVFRVTQETYEQWTRRAVPQDADLILAREAPAGNVAIVKNGQRICLGQRTVLIRPNAELVDPDFLCYYLLAPKQQASLLSGATGVTAPHVNMKDIRRLPMPDLPELTTQIWLGKLLSAYDDLIENNRRRMALVEEAARLLYQQWFIRLRFPGHRHTKITNGIPEGWKRKRIAELCQSIDYGYTASAEQEDVGPKFLRITDIVPEFIDWSSVPHCEIEDDRLNKFRLLEGDIVVARTGATVGYAKRLGKRHPEAVFASYLVRFRLKENIDNLMVGTFVESSDYKAYVQSRVGGAAQPNANAQVLAAAEMLVPTESVQQNFRELVEPMIDQREVLQIQSEKLRVARDLLLPRLMSGEIPV